MTEIVYESIKQGILQGVYRPGERLLEADLVDRTGVSRTPIREALRRLHAQGYIEFVTNKGARVATWTEQDVLDVFAIRLRVESFAARLAAERITDEQLARLESLATTMEDRRGHESGDYYLEHENLNNDFHRTIVDAAHSSNISTVMSMTVSFPRTDPSWETSPHRSLISRSTHQFTAAELERSASHHREIIDALKLRDGEWAESIVRNHVLASRAAILNGQLQP